MTQEKDIVHENGDYWVHRDKTSYVVYRNGLTHAVSDSSYPKTDDGLSIAKARVDYLANRDETRAKINARIAELGL